MLKSDNGLYRCYVSLVSEFTGRGPEEDRKKLYDGDGGQELSVDWESDNALFND